MVDLTALIITKNEELNIEKCIDSFGGLAKRFVIVDSFSTDHTLEVCKKIDKKLRDKGSRLDIYQHQFENHAAQINWGLDNTSIDTKWIMRIDADEELTPELAEEIEDKLENIDLSVNGILLKRRVYFMGKWIKHGGRYPEYLLRIFRNGYGRSEMRKMDEHIYIEEGNTTTFEKDLIDNNTKSLEWWINKHNWYSNKEVQDYYENLSLKNGVDMLSVEEHIASEQAKKKRKIKNGGYYKLPKFFRSHIYFVYRYYIRLGFLDGTEGKIFHFLQAYWYRFLVDAKIYECEKYNKRIENQGDLK